MKIKKSLTVAKWEYLEKIKTKTFLISLFLTPLIIVTFAVIPTLLSDQEESTTKMIGVLDSSGIYFSQLKEEMENYKLENGQPTYLIINLLKNGENPDSAKKKSDDQVLTGIIEGYLLISNGGTDSVKLEYRSKNIGSFRDKSRLRDAFNNVNLRYELSSRGVNPAILNIISKKADLEQVVIEESGRESSPDFLTVFFSSFIFIILLMLMVIYSGQMLVRSLLEEKSNRLIEILISSCTSDELLTGKIFGLSFLGMTQVLFWAMVGITLVGSAVVPVEAFRNILPIFGYFVLGFVFYTTIFVGIGSVVSTEQEAQQITSYLSLVMMLPVVLAIPAIQNPESLLIKILSFIPLTTPSVMMLRLNVAPVPAWEILLTLMIMLLSIFITIKLSSKIFRVGILAYGKRPSLKEISQWLREE